MRLATVLLASLTLLASALAQPPGPKPGDKPAEKPAAQPPTGEPAKPASEQPPTPPPQFEVKPVTPTPIPVPDGPVLKKQELEGGLIIEDIKFGEGYEVKPGETVIMHYHGTLKADPTKVFDSSFNRGQPLIYPLTNLVQGWQKGVPGMKIGGVRKLTVPAALGYGAQGNGPDIPPNSDLLFTIQLVDALQIQDLKAGDGEEAGQTFVAVTSQTIKDKDGKEIEKADAAHPYIWIPGEMVPQGAQFDTMQQAITGMKVGGKRRITIPKELNVVPPQANSNRPQNVPLTVEVDLIAVRNIGQRRR